MKKFSLVTAAFLVVALIVLRCMLPSLILKKANQTLATLPEYEGRIDGLSLALWRGAFTFEKIALRHQSGDVTLHVDAAAAQVRWLPLFHRHVIVQLTLRHPDLRMTVKKASEAPQKAIEKGLAANEDVKAKTGRDIPDLLANVIPFKISALYLVDGLVRIHVTDAVKKARIENKNDVDHRGEVDARLSDLKVTVQNLTNDENLSEDLNAYGEASGILMGESRVDVKIKLNPLARQPTFKLSFDIKRLHLPALNPLLDAEYGITVKRGVFSMFSEASAAEGAFKGYVRPLIHDLKMVDIRKDKNPIKIVKEAIVGAAAVILKNSKSEKVASDIPFSGRFDSPNVGIWQAVASVLTNAFIHALNPGFDKNFTPRITEQDKKTAESAKKSSVR